jgi:hypothetical protein
LVLALSDLILTSMYKGVNRNFNVMLDL